MDPKWPKHMWDNMSGYWRMQVIFVQGIAYLVPKWLNHILGMICPGIGECKYYLYEV